MRLVSLFNRFMKICLSTFLLSVITALVISANSPAVKPIRILVITGGHDYNAEHFNKMLESLGENITYKVAELPEAYAMFLPENRNKYDVLVFYHMYQVITDQQASTLADCIKEGKPLVALHHSICAFDNWPEYRNIIGGKYFHSPTTVKGRDYPACSYIHDLRFIVKVSDPENPVTKSINDFEIFDETYKGFYVEDGVIPLLTTDEPSSGPVIGWTKMYGKARVVTLQSGHDVPTFSNPNFRKLLKQSIEWAYTGSKYL
jgi:type 1 glutamine amidotransferase